MTERPGKRAPLSRRRLLGALGPAACVLGSSGCVVRPPAGPSPSPSPSPGPAASPPQPPAGLAAAELLAAIDRLSAALRRAELDGVDWQERVEQLFARADVVALRAAIILDWQAIHARTRALGRSEHRLEPGDLRDGPREPFFRRKLYSLQAGRAILPHAHRNIVSAFVVLEGEVRGRHFDRLRDEPDAIVIHPTGDRSFMPGDCAAISDHVDNVHWFTALDDRAVLFNVSVTVPERFWLRGGRTGRVYLDPDGEALEGGLIRAPRVSAAVLRGKYEG